ncbi:MAG: hypothetical protein WA532_14940 [Candidatus Korobacteraceae bacterium]
MASWFEGVSILRNWKTRNKTLWLAPFGTSDKGVGLDVRVRSISPSQVTFVFMESEETVDVKIAGARFEITDDAPIEDMPTGRFSRCVQIFSSDGSAAVIGEYSETV